MAGNYTAANHHGGDVGGTEGRARRVMEEPSRGEDTSPKAGGRRRSAKQQKRKKRADGIKALKKGV